MARANTVPFGVPPLAIAMPPFTGTYYFVDPANGSDGNSGLRPDRALATLYKAHSLCTAGKNDTVVLIGDGSTTGTARLSLALAQSVDPSATTGALAWTKNATHLIGITAPNGVANRARIAPPSGTYTEATFNSANLVTVSASGCYFSNFSLFHGFSTGAASQICWTDSGNRNYYESVHFGGIGDTASANSTGSRSLKISGSEHTFVRCTIGLDTVNLTAAAAQLEFSGGATRNKFVDCEFLAYTTATAGVLYVTVAAASAIDRYNLFNRCRFINSGLKAAGTTISAVATLVASAGGMLIFDYCSRYGVTDWGTNSTSLGQIYVDGAGTGGTAADDVGRGAVAVAS